MICYKTEEEFLDNCWFAYGLYEFVDSISGDNRWWFDVCYTDFNSDKYSILFKSYITPEYRNFLLSVEANKVDDKYVFKVIKEVTELA